MVDSSMMPMLGYLVDIRHTSVYGSVYAIGDVAFCAGFVIGPVLSGTIGRFLGFEGLVIITAFICFAFAPFLLLLRHPPILNEEQILLQGSCVKYVNYTDDEAGAAGGVTGETNSHVHRHPPTLQHLQHQDSSSSRRVNRALQQHHPHGSTAMTSLSSDPSTVTTGLNPFLNPNLPPTAVPSFHADPQPNTSGVPYVH